MEKKVILLTGINGFLGTHLAAILSGAGYTVFGLGKKEISPLSPLLEHCKRYFCGDILDNKITALAAQNADIIIHLAGITEHAQISNQRFDAFNISFQGTKNILEAFNHSKVGKTFIFPSSGKVYGSNKTLPLTEDQSCDPQNDLGKFKKMTEDLINYYQQPDKNYFILRLFNIFGSNQSPAFLVPTILTQLRQSMLKKDQTLSLTLGDIYAERDYIYIDDVCEAILSLLKSNNGENKSLNIFNICSGSPLSAQRMLIHLEETLQREIKVHSKSQWHRNDENNVEFGSHYRFSQLFNWEPQTALLQWLSQELNLSKGDHE